MSLADEMLAAFEGSKVAHGTTTVGRIGRNGKADADSRIVRQALTVEIMQGHIDGEQGVGAIPINEENKCRWGALDIDIYDLDHNELQQRIQKLKLPLLHCRSKSGGAHLYLFSKSTNRQRLYGSICWKWQLLWDTVDARSFRSRILSWRTEVT